MRLTRIVRSAERTTAAVGPGPDRRSRGQSLVEFSLVLMPLLLVLFGIIQFGLIFNGYVTLTNAVRDGAREGTIYIYDRTLTKAQNDTARNDRVKAIVLGSFNALARTAPRFTTGTTWTVSGNGLVFTNGDLTITYDVPGDIDDGDQDPDDCDDDGLDDNDEGDDGDPGDDDNDDAECDADGWDSDPRDRQRITVRATYHHDLLLPLVSELLPRDAGGRLVLVAESTMAIN